MCEKEKKSKKEMTEKKKERGSKEGKARIDSRYSGLDCTAAAVQTMLYDPDPGTCKKKGTCTPQFCRLLAQIHSKV